MEEIKKSGGVAMIPTKTLEEIDQIIHQISIKDWEHGKNKDRWVSVDVLRQKLQQVFKKAEVICYAANGDEIIMYDPKILKEVLVGLEPEEAKA